MKILEELGRYWLFMASIFRKPEKYSVYRRRVLDEIESIGVTSLGIVTLISVFMGAVITIQTVYNLVSPLVPIYVVGVVVRDSMIIEFSPTIIMLVIAGKVGSSIASEIGTMRVTEQIDALEIMGINASGYLVMPKLIAAIFITPFLVMISMFVSIVPLTLKSPIIDFKFPSIKTQVSAPMVAASETKFKKTAFIGNKIEPVKAKSKTNMVIIIQAMTRIRLSLIAA